jgi:hypothetical protein
MPSQQQSGPRNCHERDRLLRSHGAGPQRMDNHPDGGTPSTELGPEALLESCPELGERRSAAADPRDLNR